MQTEDVLRDIASQHVSAPAREITDSALIGLIAATSESLRRQEHRFPSTKALEPELFRQHSEAPDLYHGPTVAGWPTP